MTIPDGWIKIQIGQICDNITSGSRGWASYYVENNGDKFIRITNLRRDNIIPDYSKMKFIKLPENFTEGTRTRLKQNDILISITADLGIIGFIDKEPSVPSYINQHIALVRLKTENALPKFIAYLLSSKIYQKRFGSLNDAGAKAGLNLSTIGAISFYAPPLPEQIKIADILSTWDKAIEAQEKLITNSETLKKALMQQLLTGKKRLKGFSGAWEEKKLGEVGEINSGGTPKSSVKEYYDGDIPWVSIADMTEHGKYINKTKTNISILGLKNSSARLYAKNTILYAMYASIGECSIANIELTSSQAILGIRCKTDVLNYIYLYFYLSSLKDKIKLQGQQGTQSNLNAGMVKEFRLKLPPLPEQTAITHILSDSDTEIALQKQKLSLLKQEKTALMQELLTGKRRVVV